MQENNHSNEIQSRIYSDKVDVLNRIIDGMMSDKTVSYVTIIVQIDDDGRMTYMLHYNNILEALTLLDIAASEIEKKLT